jgi:hypothetical protein
MSDGKGWKKASAGGMNSLAIAYPPCGVVVFTSSDDHGILLAESNGGLIS